MKGIGNVRKKKRRKTNVGGPRAGKKHLSHQPTSKLKRAQFLLHLRLGKKGDFDPDGGKEKFHSASTSDKRRESEEVFAGMGF